jgi:Glycosyl hydrolases family 25/Putative peptidoglycan binding domain
MARKFIDVSSNNHPGNAPIDWAQVKAAGVDGVFVKVTEGSNYVNPWAVRDIAGASAAGLEVATYHFARPEMNTPGAEAAWYVQHLGSSVRPDRKALDLEDGARLGWRALAAWVQGFIAAAPTDDLYVNDWYRTFLAATGQHLLVKVWAAEPGDQGIPDGFDAVQYGQEMIAGIVGPVDVNLVAWPAPGDAVQPPAAPPGTLTAGLPNLFLGASGGYVAVAQRLLAYGGGALTIDGVFGPTTDAAVRQFQQRHQLAADGVIGPLTWRALLG